MITKLETQLVNMFVARNLDAYKKFMGIHYMPDFNIVPMEISLETANKKGYGVPAAHSYDVNTGKHTLKVWKDIYKSLLHADYLIFHELTHMYDTDKHSAKNKFLYAANRGYTEYHAAQVDLMRLLGAESIEDTLSFSLLQSVEIISGRKTIFEYITNPKVAVTKLISRPDFPDSIESLSTGLGMIFNHLGRISICQMYANDYDKYKDEIENMTVEGSYIGDRFSDVKLIMKGFLDNKEIFQISQIYFPMIIELAKQIEGYH